MLHTKCFIFILIPEGKIFFNALVTMKLGCVAGALYQLIGCRKDMFTPFTLHVASTSHVHWVPVQLVQTVVGMAVKHTDHKVQTKGLSSGSKTTGIHHL